MNPAPMQQCVKISLAPQFLGAYGIQYIVERLLALSGRGAVRPLVGWAALRFIRQDFAKTMTKYGKAKICARAGRRSGYGGTNVQGIPGSIIHSTY